MAPLSAVPESSSSKPITISIGNPIIVTTESLVNSDIYNKSLAQRSVYKHSYAKCQRSGVEWCGDKCKDWMGVVGRPLRMICSWSARTSKVLMLDRSSGMRCILFHVPQANWKKSWQGSAVRFIAISNEAAVSIKGFDLSKSSHQSHPFYAPVRTHSSVKQTAVSPV